MDTNRCSPCGQEFTTKKILAKHLEIHHDNRKFKCVKCDKEVVGKTKLNNHMRSHKSVCCKFCGLQVAHGSLPFHQTKCSDNKKGILYSCDKCDYKTDQKGNLKRHKSTHTVKENGQVVHNCVHCKKNIQIKETFEAAFENTFKN